MASKYTTLISVEIRRLGPRAILVDNGLENPDGTEKLIWLPKSEIYNWDEIGDVAIEGETVDVLLPEWLALNENLT